MIKKYAIIPIRAKSKRFPDKNIQMTYGYPLFYFQLHALKKSRKFADIIVSSDSDSYLALAKFYGATIHKRSEKSSADEASSEAVISEILDDFNLEDDDWFFLCQATNPFNEPKYIDNACRLIDEQNVNSVMTRVETKRFDTDEILQGKRVREQERDPKYLETGLFWATNVKEFKRVGSRVIEPVGFIDIDKNNDFDIDCKEDYLFVRSRLISRIKKIDGLYKKVELRTDEKDYFRYTKDPDGNERNLINEDEGRSEFARSEISFLDGFLKPDMTLLDIGCGTLAITKKYKNLPVELWGVEPDEEAGIIGKGRADKFFIDIIENVADDIPDNYFDVIFAFHVIEHVVEPIEFIKTINRKLKSGGLLIIATPDFDSAMARRYKDQFRLLHDPTRISLLSNDSLTTLLDDSGFRIDYKDFPYFESKWFTKDNLLKVLKSNIISPPFYGNVMTFYCTKEVEAD